MSAQSMLNHKSPGKYSVARQTKAPNPAANISLTRSSNFHLNGLSICFDCPWRREATSLHQAVILIERLSVSPTGEHTLIYGDAVDGVIACARGPGLACADSRAKWCCAPLWKIHLQGRRRRLDSCASPADDACWRNAKTKPPEVN